MMTESQYIINQAKELAIAIQEARAELAKPGHGSVKTARMMFLQVNSQARKLVKDIQAYAAGEEARISQTVAAELRREEIARMLSGAEVTDEAAPSKGGP